IIGIGESKKRMVTKDETKVVEQTGNDYELVIIVHPEVADDALDPIINSLTQYVTNKAGTVVEVARWGRKRLAYPIKHLMEGNYVLFKFKMDPAANKAMETNLKISEKIIRYLLIKTS
ncbi:MAG TPA: 30S ribosomal protein S6, partial [Dehalococcoidales bacterium]|nr:30S ribosomal protein S6 [Dehalococcoidales bacterium]